MLSGLQRRSRSFNAESASSFRSEGGYGVGIDNGRLAAWDIIKKPVNWHSLAAITSAMLRYVLNGPWTGSSRSLLADSIGYSPYIGMTNPTGNWTVSPYVGNRSNQSTRSLLGRCCASIGLQQGLARSNWGWSRGCSAISSPLLKPARISPLSLRSSSWQVHST